MEVRWIKNCLNGRSQRVTISRVKSSRKPAVRCPSIISEVGLFQLIKGLDVGTQCMLSKSAYDTKLEEWLMSV